MILAFSMSCVLALQPLTAYGYEEGAVADSDTIPVFRIDEDDLINNSGVAVPWNSDLSLDELRLVKIANELNSYVAGYGGPVGSEDVEKFLSNKGYDSPVTIINSNEDEDEDEDEDFNNVLAFAGGGIVAMGVPLLTAVPGGQVVLVVIATVAGLIMFVVGAANLGDEMINFISDSDIFKRLLDNTKSELKRVQILLTNSVNWDFFLLTLF